MSVDHIWENEVWTKQARQLVRGLRDFPKESKIILIVRHSYRDSSDDMWEVAKFKLTKLGHEMAIKFGSQLPTKKTIRIYFSAIERCKETAEDVLQGFQTASGYGQLMYSLKELFNFDMNPDMFFKQITVYQFEEFLYRWAAGLYSPEIITPFEVFCQQAAKIIWNSNLDAPENSIDVHVSHDLITLSFRLGWFGLSPSDFWPSFLGGFAFAINEEDILLLDHDGFKTIELPYWWKK